MKVLFLLCFVAAGALAQFTTSGQQAIVDAHNKLRSSIAKGTYVAKGITQKPGANIRKIKWDNAVATGAQAYANGCPTGHAERTARNGYGENLYFMKTSSTGSLDNYGTEASAGWESEFQYIGWTSNTYEISTGNSVIGHATQMAWADTYAIGCGVKSCKRDTSMGNLNEIVVVCRYNPPGNYIGRTIYQQGKTCSACPSGTSCESSSGLCI